VFGGDSANNASHIHAFDEDEENWAEYFEEYLQLQRENNER